MSDEFVDPIGESPRAPRIESGGRREQHQSPQRGRIRGEITAVHRQAGHKEPGHLLDTTVGAQPYNEIVVRVEEDDLSELIGKSVLLQVLP